MPFASFAHFVAIPMKPKRSCALCHESLEHNGEKYNGFQFFRSRKNIEAMAITLNLTINQMGFFNVMDEVCHRHYDIPDYGFEYKQTSYIKKTPPASHKSVMDANRQKRRFKLTNSMRAHFHTALSLSKNSLREFVGLNRRFCRFASITATNAVFHKRGLPGVGEALQFVPPTSPVAGAISVRNHVREIETNSTMSPRIVTVRRKMYSKLQ